MSGLAREGGRGRLRGQASNTPSPLKSGRRLLEGVKICISGNRGSLRSCAGREFLAERVGPLSWLQQSGPGGLRGWVEGGRPGDGNKAGRGRKATLNALWHQNGLEIKTLGNCWRSEAVCGSQALLASKWFLFYLLIPPVSGLSPHILLWSNQGGDPRHLPIQRRARVIPA